MEQETYQASESMQKFFNKLLDLKQFVKQEFEKESNEGNLILAEIMQRLEICIQEEK